MNMTKKIHAVGIVLEDEKGQMLVLKRRAHVPEGATWGLVGGKVKDGLDPASTAANKAQEEIGYSVDTSKLQFFKSYHWDRDDLDLTFDVYKLTTHKDDVDLKINQDGHTEYKWETPANLYGYKDLMRGLYPILEDIYKVK